jgi:hypothetical protein
MELFDHLHNCQQSKEDLTSSYLVSLYFVLGIQHDCASKLPLCAILFVLQRRAVTAENCVSKLKAELDLVMVSRLYQQFRNKTLS